MGKIKGFYKKKDRHGRMVTHPITEPLQRIRQEPFMKVYRPQVGRKESTDDVDKVFVKEVEGYKVYKVDSDHVKKRYALDYFFCGHGRALKFIPVDEIWIKAGRGKALDEASIFHEIVESELMKDGMEYRSAHAKSEALEKQLKRDNRWDERLDVIRQVKQGKKVD